MTKLEMHHEFHSKCIYEITVEIVLEIHHETVLEYVTCDMKSL